MNLLQNILHDIVSGAGTAGHAVPQAHGQLMQVGPHGTAIPSNQGNLPPQMQKDTWLSNDPTAMRAPAPMHSIGRPAASFHPLTPGIIPLGQRHAVEGYYPQDQLGNGYENPVQQGGYNGQTTVGGGLQQGAYTPYGRYGQAADPLGWN